MGRAVYVSVQARTRDIYENERLIKKFIKETKKSGVLERFREKRYFVKKSEKRNAKRRRKKTISRESTKKNKN